jgi:hypothetical protein
MSVLKNSIKTGGSLGTDKIVIVRITIKNYLAFIAKQENSANTIFVVKKLPKHILLIYSSAIRMLMFF